MNQLYIYKDPLFFLFPSSLGHHRVLSRVPCAVSSFSLVINKRGNILYRKNDEDLQKSVCALRASIIQEHVGHIPKRKVLLLFMEAIRPNVNVNKLGESISG